MGFGRFLTKQRYSILAFFLTWFVYGAMTSAEDLHFYGLYQTGAESIVDFHTFTVGHSKNPEMRDGGDGDVFIYQDRKYIAKQPGAFVTTAIPYALLKSFGFNYVNDYRFVSAMTSWMTAGLLAALSVVLFYHFLISLGTSHTISLLTTVTYGFGTTLFPYTGIPHHDVIASVIFFFAFMMFCRLSVASSNRQIALAGGMLGLTLFFSMLPALLVALLLFFALIKLKIKRATLYGAAFVIANWPLFLCNYINYGSPLRQANMAGNYQNTFFNPSFSQFFVRLDQYFGIANNMSATKNMPVFILGLAGLFFLKERLRQLQWMLITFCCVHMFYLFNIGTEGHCQFGPRYFIPLIPLVLVGFTVWFENGAQRAIALILIAYSLLINTVGAVGNSMVCTNLVFFEPTRLMANFKSAIHEPRPLLPTLAGLSVISLAIWLVTAILRYRAQRSLIHR